MSLDLYQPCPGGLDKKIKFCCKDLAHSLESVSRKLDGGQLQAADEELDRLLQQYPDRQCLWAMKVQAELAMTDVAGVRSSNDKFLAIAPQNPIALAVAAIISATDETAVASAEESRSVTEDVSPECRRAIEFLQSALENTGDSIPIQIYDALGVVAERLIAESMYMAAREHLAFQIMLDREHSEGAYARFLGISRSSGLNILLRQDMTLPPVPEEAGPWKEAYRQAYAAGSRGLWRAAAGQLEALAASHDAPLIQRALGILYCRLAENAKAVTAWRKFARASATDHEDAVEAEALAQLMDPHSEPPTVDLLQFTLPIQDVDAVLTALQSDQRFQAMRFESSAEDEGPPPRAVFQIQDRLLPEGQEIAAQDLPLALGELLLYGKETDKPARLVFIAVRDRAGQIQEQLRSVLHKQVAGEAAEEVLTKIPRPAVMDLLRPVQPRQATIRQRVAWASDFYEQVVLDKWLELPLEVLSGKTPREACGDDSQQLALEAAVLLLETSRNTDQTPVFQRLRERLGLPAMRRIEADHETMRTLPVVRFHRVEPHALSDDDLLTSFAIANQTRYAPAANVLCRELLRRPSVQGQIKRDQIYGLLASMSDDLDESLQLLQDAQKAATKAGTSPARWKVSEFGLRILRQEMAEAQLVLRDIQTHHIREPGVADLLSAELYRYGLARPPSAARPPAPTAAAAAAPVSRDDQAQVILGADEPAAAAEGTSPPSKLWLPGMD